MPYLFIYFIFIYPKSLQIEGSDPDPFDPQNGEKIQISCQTPLSSKPKLLFHPARVSAPRFSWFLLFSHFDPRAKNSNFFPSLFPLRENSFPRISSCWISTARSDFVEKLWGAICLWCFAVLVVFLVWKSTLWVFELWFLLFAPSLFIKLTSLLIETSTFYFWISYFD